MTEPVSAQHSDPAASPDAVASAFFAALDAQRWREAAALVHPTALAHYREQTLATIRHRDGQNLEPLTVEDLLRSDPEIPREVAEYKVSKSARRVPESGSWALEQAGVASVEEFERLSAEDAFARFAAVNDVRTTMQRGLPEEADPAVRDLATRAFGGTTRVVLGSVPAPPAVAGLPSRAAYVTYLVSHGGRLGLERVMVLGTRLNGTDWKVDFAEAMAHELFGASVGWTVTRVTDDPFDLAEMVRQPVSWPDDEAPQLRASMAGAGADPLKEPPTTLILEQLAADGATAARVEIPAPAWARLDSVISLWGLLIQSPPEPES